MLNEQSNVIAAGSNRRNLENHATKTIVRSSRKAPRSTSASRLRWVAAISLTSIRVVRVESTGLISPC